MQSVEDEWERELESEESLNLLFVSYNNEDISIERMLQTIKGLGFEATVKDQK